MDMLVGMLDSLIELIRQSMPEGSYFNHEFNILAFLAVISVCFICGSIGGQVVGNRMAFFSDALAHCAFAGFAVAAVLFIAFGRGQGQLRDWMLITMALCGVGVGLLIALVRDTTGLPSDTVIGVFFAGAIGLGAVVMRAVKGPGFDIESFIFGNPQTARPQDVIYLFLLLLVTAVFLALFYNRLVLASVNPSLALSRGVSVRLCQYLFVILLGLVVNLCLFVVGTLLINALLIVPAATAANLCRNLRQLYWCSLGFAIVSGLGGLFLSWELNIRWRIEIGGGGAIVVLNVLFFILSMFIGPWIRDRKTA